MTWSLSRQGGEQPPTGAGPRAPLGRLIVNRRKQLQA